VKWPGRHYRRRYGYPIRWAVLAELAWRIEHFPAMPWAREDRQSRLRMNGYRWRKHFERRATNG